MRDNKQGIQINKPIEFVFNFTITPPNSSLWIPGVVDEKTNELPVKVGTIYTLTNKQGKKSRVIVSEITKNRLVGWRSGDGNYHCQYNYVSLEGNSTHLEYYEWVDEGEIEEPFTMDILEKLKEVIEKK